MSDMQYIQVGTSYFKKVKAPTISGDFNEILVPWNIDTIKHDYGKTLVVGTLIASILNWLILMP
jgi:hypothetical protein